MDLPISGLAARGAGVYRVGAFRIAWPHVPASQPLLSLNRRRQSVPKLVEKLAIWTLRKSMSDVRCVFKGIFKVLSMCSSGHRSSRQNFSHVTHWPWCLFCLHLQHWFNHVIIFERVLLSRDSVCVCGGEAVNIGIQWKVLIMPLLCSVTKNVTTFICYLHIFP